MGIGCSASAESPGCTQQRLTPFISPVRQWSRIKPLRDAVLERSGSEEVARRRVVAVVIAIEKRTDVGFRLLIFLVERISHVNHRVRLAPQPIHQAVIEARSAGQLVGYVATAKGEDQHQLLPSRGALCKIFYTAPSPAAEFVHAKTQSLFHRTFRPLR